QGLDERRLVDEAATAGVDEDRSAGHRRQPGGVDHPAGLVGEGDDEHEHVAAADELVELAVGRPVLLLPGAPAPRPVRHLAVEGGEANRAAAADVAEADDPDPPAAQLAAAAVRGLELGPAPGAHLG